MSLSINIIKSNKNSSACGGLAGEDKDEGRRVVVVFLHTLNKQTISVSTVRQSALQGKTFPPKGVMMTRNSLYLCNRRFSEGKRGASTEPVVNAVYRRLC